MAKSGQTSDSAVHLVENVAARLFDLSCGLCPVIPNEPDSTLARTTTITKNTEPIPTGPPPKKSDKSWILNCASVK